MWLEVTPLFCPPKIPTTVTSTSLSDFFSLSASFGLPFNLILSPTLILFFLAKPSWIKTEFLSSSLRCLPSCNLSVSAENLSSNEESLVPLTITVLEKSCLCLLFFSSCWWLASFNGSKSIRSALTFILFIYFFTPGRFFIFSISSPIKLPAPLAVPGLVFLLISIEKLLVIFWKVSLDKASVDFFIEIVLKINDDIVTKIKKITNDLKLFLVIYNQAFVKIDIFYTSFYNILT